MICVDTASCGLLWLDKWIAVGGSSVLLYCFRRHNTDSLNGQHKKGVEMFTRTTTTGVVWQGEYKHVLAVVAVLHPPMYIFVRLQFAYCVTVWNKGNVLRNLRRRFPFYHVYSILAATPTTNFAWLQMQLTRSDLYNMHLRWVEWLKWKTTRQRPGLVCWGEEDNGWLYRGRRGGRQLYDECECEIQHQKTHCSRPSTAVNWVFTYSEQLLGWVYEIGNLFIFQFANSSPPPQPIVLSQRHERGVRWNWMDLLQDQEDYKVPTRLVVYV